MSCGAADRTLGLVAVVVNCGIIGRRMSLGGMPGGGPGGMRMDRRGGKPGGGPGGMFGRPGGGPGGRRIAIRGRTDRGMGGGGRNSMPVVGGTKTCWKIQEYK